MSALSLYTVTHKFTLSLIAHKGKYILSDTDTQELAEIMSELVNSLVDIWVKPAKQVARIRQLIPAKKR